MSAAESLLDEAIADQEATVKRVTARRSEAIRAGAAAQRVLDAEKRELEELRQARRDIEEAKRSRMVSAGVTE